MLLLRSLFFQLCFVLNVGFFGLLGLPTFFFRPKGPLWLNALVSSITEKLLYIICNIKVEVRGRENLPKDHGYLVIAKHQSTFDTLVISTIFPQPAFVFKHQLLWVPIFGAYLWAAKMIMIRREDGAKTMRAMLRDAKVAAAERREITIFAEGTRKLPGAPLDYKPGAYFLYKGLNLQTVTVATNSGFFWPKNGLIHRPGTLIVEILPTVGPGLSKQEYQSEIIDPIEKACHQLNQETLAQNPDFQI